ncbi:uncharacterized protein LOC111358469 isoform X2 [Spodoptera litura]|uniref:Uncharacterized protein LOC111358469 isoform X2 n=1 Tax=Spodoptera litura TaxID=69820 RepID=A0A9J7EJ12_SPOLT|nr:uncharacterized protein LOC111358469 isoform X2 [Spodoptera litura]
MMSSNTVFKSTFGALLLVQLAVQVSAGTKFASHVSINTPARSFTHGVGDPLPLLAKRNYNRQSSFRSLPPPPPPRGSGYPRVKPTIPFSNEDRFRDNSINGSPWQYNNYMDVAIPVLPPSPYKVDSPDPESLWPEGLFIPPFNPPRFAASKRRSEVLSDAESLDPYLLEGSEAIAAVKRASRHGLYYFDDIPHIESLLANQELRIENNLKPHRLGSIRQTWPYNRP